MGNFATVIRKIIYSLIIFAIVFISYWQWEESQARFLDSGLVGYWPFEDAPSITAIDKSGNGNNGTLTNGPKYTNGKIGQAVDFDAVNDLINAGSGSTIDDIFANGGTVSFWFNIRSLTASGTFRNRFIVKRSTIGWFIDVKDTQAIMLFFAQFSTNGGQWQTPTNTATLNQWIHFAVTYDGSSTANDPIFYINGGRVATTEVGTPSGTFQSDATETLLLGNTSAGGKATDGKMDDVRLYNRALSANEIHQLYIKGKKSRGTPTGSLSNPFIW